MVGAGAIWPPPWSGLRSQSGEQVLLHVGCRVLVCGPAGDLFQSSFSSAPSWHPSAVPQRPRGFTAAFWADACRVLAGPRFLSKGRFRRSLGTFIFSSPFWARRNRGLCVAPSERYINCLLQTPLFALLHFPQLNSAPGVNCTLSMHNCRGG